LSKRNESGELTSNGTNEQSSIYPKKISSVALINSLRFPAMHRTPTASLSPGMGENENLPSLSSAQLSGGRYFFFSPYQAWVRSQETNKKRFGIDMIQ